MGRGIREVSWGIVLGLLAAVFGPAGSGAGEIPESEYWKNEIVYPDDPFRASGTYEGDPGWVKFTLLLGPYDPNVVYFQDSGVYPFHYHFATELLTPFLGMSPQEYDEVTLYEQGQQAILGAVILPPLQGWPPASMYREYGIQFVRNDPYTREHIAELFTIVKGCVAAEAEIEVFFFPAYEQMATAEANRDWFEAQGIPISSSARWSGGDVYYSTGWALG